MELVLARLVDAVGVNHILTQMLQLAQDRQREVIDAATSAGQLNIGELNLGAAAPNGSLAIASDDSINFV